MPIDFDDGDISEEVAEEIQQVYDAPVQAPTEEDVDEQMSEVEKRLEMAQYYRLLLSDSLFDSPSSPEVAERVESEIRDFVRSRMSVLVGVGTEQKKSPQLMTDDEAKLLREIANPEVIRVIKELAAKLLKKPSIMDFKPKPVAAEEPKPQPKVNKEPTLRRVPPRPGARQGNRAAPPPSAQAQQPIVIEGDQEVPVAKPGQRQRKVFRKIVTEDGKVIKQDVTPQAKPVGVQPIPTPRTKEQISLAMATASATHGQVAVSTLGKKLSGDVEGN